MAYRICRDFWGLVIYIYIFFFLNFFFLGGVIGFRDRQGILLANGRGTP